LGFWFPKTFLKKSLLKIKVGGIFEYVAAKQATNFIKKYKKLLDFRLKNLV
jgi:hypothetical protein